MFKKIVRRTSVGIPVVLLAYLGLAGAWSAAAIDDVLAQHPMAAGLATLSQQQSATLLKIEDPTFFEHAGLSLANGQGATTITSSVARDIFLFQTKLDGAKGALQGFYRAVFACCKKIDLGRDVMALVLNANLSKEKQLSVFVAQVYMGNRQGVQLRGLEQASQAYFGKPLKDTTSAEFSGLVGMIKAPNTFHPDNNKAAYALRLARVDAVASGRCAPAGWFDTAYEQCSAAPAGVQ